jgi:hypothetical protein
MTAFTADISVDLNDLYTVSNVTESVNAMQALVPQAISLIETITGVFFSATYREVEISVTDAAWLKKAALYQTIFMVENDVLTNKSVTSVSQDGLSINAPDGLTFILAPLAKRAINNCSWTKSGTLKVAAPDAVATSNDFLTNDAHAWSPIGGN